MADNDGGVIRWEDPPPPMTGGVPATQMRPWALVAAQLRSRPGEWALIDRDGNIALGPRIVKGTSWWAPKGSFTAVTRIVDGEVRIYAKYVGAP